MNMKNEADENLHAAVVEAANVIQMMALMNMVVLKFEIIICKEYEFKKVIV